MISIKKQKKRQSAEFWNVQTCFWMHNYILYSIFYSKQKKIYFYYILLLLLLLLLWCYCFYLFEDRYIFQFKIILGLLSTSSFSIFSCKKRKKKKKLNHHNNSSSSSSMYVCSRNRFFFFWFSSDFAYYYPISYKLAIFEKMIMIITATYSVLLYFCIFKKGQKLNFAIFWSWKTEILHIYFVI